MDIFYVRVLPAFFLARLVYVLGIDAGRSFGDLKTAIPEPSTLLYELENQGCASSV